MSKHQKALAKLCAIPTPSDFTWNELTGVLGHLGYEVLKNNGSRRKFVHKATKALIICHEPHPAKIVDKGCIADIVAHLQINGFI